MTRIDVLAVALGLLTLAACSGHKPPNTQPAAVQVQVGDPVKR